MTVELHPDASRRFDELGVELRKRVIECGTVESPKAGFRPEVYPMANIGEDDVIGEVRVTRSIVNGMHEEIGRMFEKNKAKFGIVGEGYKALIKLATQIQTTAVLRDKVNVEFVRDLIFEWVVGNHGQSENSSLAGFVLQEANSNIRGYEIWIPIHQFYVEKSLSIGGVEFQTVPGAIIEGWHAKVMAANAETKVKRSTQERITTSVSSGFVIPTALYDFCAPLDITTLLAKWGTTSASQWT